MKHCKRCNKTKLESEFSLFNNRLNKDCTDCRTKLNNYYKVDKDGVRQKRQEYYIRNKTRIASYRSVIRLKKKYNLTPEMFKQMLIAQDNKCAICEISFTTLKPCVDHDHKTGKVRGLLCRNCNLSLHYIENGFIKKAQIYLNQ